MKKETFKEHFKDFNCYDEGGELDQRIVGDAEKVYETLKTPEAIKNFQKADYKDQEEMVKGLDEGHSGFSFNCVCKLAFEYAEYAQQIESRDKHPELVKAIKDTKFNDGQPVFTEDEIDAIFLNCQKTIENHPDRIMAVLNNPEEIEMIADYKNRAAGLWRATVDPLQSTIDKNPKAFEKTAEEKAELAALMNEVMGRKIR